MGRGKRCWAWTHSPGQRAGADTIPRNPTEELSEAWVQQDVQAGSRGSGTFLSHPTVCSRASRVRNSSCGACRHRDQVLGWPASPRRSGCYRGTCLSPPKNAFFLICLEVAGGAAGAGCQARDRHKGARPQRCRPLGE